MAERASDANVDAAAKECGHRFGNFWNYYKFNPAAERLRFLEDSRPALRALRSLTSVEYAAARGPMRILDVGCNSGELTMALCMLLLDDETSCSVQPEGSSSHGATPCAIDTSASSSRTQGTTAHATSTGARLSALGIDLDGELIRRATVSAASNVDLARAGAQVRFVRGDVSSSDADESLLQPFEACIGDSTAAGDVVSGVPGLLDVPQRRYRFDLACCFSTTMWVHLNGGDAALRRLLRLLSGSCERLLIEPQPWKCYTSAATRLKRRKLAPHTELPKLAMRGESLATEIDRFLLSPDCGFSHRELLGETQWGRSLFLYTREDGDGKSCEGASVGNLGHSTRK